MARSRPEPKRSEADCGDRFARAGRAHQVGFGAGVACLTRHLTGVVVSDSRSREQGEIMTDAEEIAEAFELIDDWEERYRYVIELGRELPEFPDALKTDATKVEGCVSQVWLTTGARDHGLELKGDSDAMIVRGLVAILIAFYANRPVEDVPTLDVEGYLKRLQLDEHLTPQRSNGLMSMVKRIRQDSARLAADAA
jgi:cysteine desulfuration protein SufE